jgi:hypothetical protein
MVEVPEFAQALQGYNSYATAPDHEKCRHKALYFRSFFVGFLRALTFAPERWQSGRLRRS